MRTSSSITWQGALWVTLSSMGELAQPGSIGAPALAILLYVLTHTCHMACTARGSRNSSATLKCRAA